MEKVTQVKLGEEIFEVDIEKVVGIGDLDEDMDRVSAQIAFYGKLLGEARKETTLLDSLYRKWRAAVAVKTLADDPKVSEWKVKAAIEADDKFTAYKKAQGQCEFNVTFLESVVKGLVEKSQNLRSKGARLRAEAEALNTGTKQR